MFYNNMEAVISILKQKTWESDKAMADKFWSTLDQMIATNDIIIDRPKGSRHPRYQDVVYPLDYGYLAGTSSGDGDGVDLWQGSLNTLALVGVVCCVDLSKQDVELKLLLGCKESDMTTITQFHNGGSQAALLLRRAELDT